MDPLACHLDTCLEMGLPPEFLPIVKESFLYNFAAQIIYVPIRERGKDRNEIIIARYLSGENMGSLCREFKISRRRFEQIHRQYRRSKIFIPR